MTPTAPISGAADRYDHRAGNDDYTQAGDLFRLLPADEKARLIAALGSVPREIQVRQVRHFAKADPAYGEGVARGLGISPAEIAAQ